MSDRVRRGEQTKIMEIWPLSQKQAVDVLLDQKETNRLRSRHIFSRHVIAVQQCKLLCTNKGNNERLYYCYVTWKAIASLLIKLTDMYNTIVVLLSVFHM